MAKSFINVHGGSPYFPGLTPSQPNINWGKIPPRKNPFKKVPKTPNLPIPKTPIWGIPPGGGNWGALPLWKARNSYKSLLLRVGIGNLWPL